MLTRDKNVDLYEILMNLDDISLLNFCKASFKQEYEKSLCADETFWKIRTEKYYPVAHEIKKDDLKWKKYYLRIVYYKDKMEREYGFGFTDGDAKEYYDILDSDDYFDNDDPYINIKNRINGISHMYKIAKDLGHQDLAEFIKLKNAKPTLIRKPLNRN